MKDIYILDKELNTIAVFDYYKSLIWSNRYYKTGDFELQIPLNENTKSKLKHGFYVYRDTDFINGVIRSPKLIEKIELVDSKSDYSLIVSGRDVSAILERRIVYPTETMSGSVESCIYNLIDKHLVNPENINRKIPNIKITDTSTINDIIDKQVTGDTLLAVVEDVCNDFKYGFRINLDTTTNDFVFELYSGVDRSDSVEVSHEFDNMTSNDYVKDDSEFRNTAWACGYGEGADRKSVLLNDENIGLDRYELFVDARDLTQYDSEGKEITEATYLEQLKQRASEKLAEADANVTNSCDVEINTGFVFNKDYFLGDIIICKGYEDFKERIVETTESNTASGVKTELTFEEEK